MAAWFTAALPFIPDVIKLATPYFTRKPPTQDPAPGLVAQQIVELQDVATQNADSIRMLAIEMQKTIETLQIGANSMSGQFTALSESLHRARTLAVVAATVAVVALAVAVAAIAT